MKKFTAIFVSFLILFSFGGCGKTENNPPSTEESTTFAAESTLAPTQSETTTLPTTTQPQTQAPTQPTTKKPAPSTTEKVQETQNTTQGATYEKTGEMAFSDSPDNRYIAAISAKYGVDSALLVALYTVPENDSNIVLEFNGAKNANGEPIRNKNTLTAIYTIDKALNSKCASEDKSRNEYPYGEMKVIYFSTTKYIMPEFPQLMMEE